MSSVFEHGGLIFWGMWLLRLNPEAYTGNLNRNKQLLNIKLQIPSPKASGPASPGISKGGGHVYEVRAYIVNMAIVSDTSTRSQDDIENRIFRPLSYRRCRAQVLSAVSSEAGREDVRVSLWVCSTATRRTRG